MEWSSIKMSKAEFERLQKEYTAAAMKAAEKAKLSTPTEEVSVAVPQSVPAAQIVAEAVIATANENTAEPEVVETEMTENADLSENDIETATVREESGDIEISAEAIDDTEEEISAEPESETPDNGESSDCDCDEEAETPQDTSDFQREEEICDDESSENDAPDECDTADEHTDEEILDSFASVFMSEDEANKRVEKLSADKRKNSPPPSFNAAIHNHNKSMSNSKKPCGCERCRCQSGGHMQEKGGHKPD